ncbi:hypothetical protein B0O99DRAFT_67342 [Bisporella sp. PMI_857]|nr:hypothetical protein B0O99DRAFT_67342 [Bisporella sp. PMI_857]
MRPPPHTWGWGAGMMGFAPRFVCRKNKHRPQLFCSLPLGFRGGKRLFSSGRETYEGDADIDTFDVKCASKGSITVDVYNRQALSNPSKPLIFYLQPAGTHIRSAHLPIPPFLLDKERDLPLARVNYRWNHVPPQSISASPHEQPPSPADPSPEPAFNSAEHQLFAFPTPLHDTLAAYTYLQEFYIPQLDPQSSSQPPLSASSSKPHSHPRPLIIYGSHLSASLALSLALTESFSSALKPEISVILQNGVYDWTSIATSVPPEPISDLEKNGTAKIWDAVAKQLASKNPLDLQTLHALKSSLFDKPAAAFDSFASPILFFRTPGFSIPRYFPGMKPPSPPPADLAGLSLSEAERLDLEFRLGAEDPTSSSPKNSEEDDEIETLRRSPLKFPPLHSGLKIPRTLFLCSNEKFYKKQVEEMAKVMRRSITRDEMKNHVQSETGGAEQRVQMLELEGGDIEKEVGEWIES